MIAVIAHRGASAIAPENTMAAMEAAINLGVDYIEVDVRMTLDNIPVVIHDATVNRTTNGRGAVLSYYYASLKKLDAGSWFHPKFSEERIPSLNEVMRQVLPHTKLLIELKGNVLSQPLMARSIVDLINKYDAADKCIIQSFSAPLLKAIHRENENITINLLVNYYNNKLPVYRDILPKLGNIYRFKFNDAFNPNHKWVTPETIENIRNKGRKIFCWTVDKEDEMRKLIALGVDGIITNKPDLLKKVIESERA